MEGGREGMSEGGYVIGCVGWIGVVGWMDGWIDGWMDGWMEEYVSGCVGWIGGVGWMG